MKSFGLSSLITLMLLLSGVGCNKLSTAIQKTPIFFDGLNGIEISTEGAYVINWSFPSGAELESFSIYYTRIDGATAEALSPDASTATSGLLVTPEAALMPAQTGQLLSIVDPASSNFKTPSLDEGYYLFQVKALTKDGRVDENTIVYLLKVNPTDGFRGIISANIVGTDLQIAWLPAPGIRESENYHYTVYKGPAFNSAVAYTKELSYTYSLTNEVEGDTVFFGVRYTDGQSREEQNTTLIAVTIPEFNKNYLGCIRASAVAADRVKLDFEWPQSAKFTEMRVYRNQREVFTTREASVVSMIDRGLSEGEVYTYNCMAISDTETLSGVNVLKVSTLSTNPPTFAGIKTAAAESPHVGLLSWGVSSGVPAKEFQVYATPGNTVAWESEPKLRLSVSKLTGKVEGLGDDLPYSFGVRACTTATCDSNSEQITVTMPDAGAPTSPGINALRIEQGKLRIEAPWLPEYGRVSRRHIYVKVDGLATQTIGDYTLTRTVLSAGPLDVPEVMFLDNLLPGTPYHVIVRDEDEHGNRSTNTKVLSVTTGDLTPPDFNGISGLETGPTGQEETSLKVLFTALDPASIAIRGAASYRFYARQGGGAACNENYFRTEVSGESYAAGNAQYLLTGLNAKTIYSVCVKVVDKYQNISVNTNFLARSTLDKTKPEFDGIQTLSFDAVNSLVNVAWNSSPSNDVYEYKIETWLTPSGTSSAIATTISRLHSQSPNSFAMNRNVIPFQSGDKLEVVVTACDNAASIPGGAQNCTTASRTNALSLIFQDILPPPGFLGIAAVGSQETPAQGQIGVHWIAPNDWTDYSGFKVYTVGSGNALTVVKDCPCSGENCPDQISSCLLTDLDHFRTYRLHVRAYDAHGNYTLLDPIVSFADVRTSDTTAPVFTSNLALSFASGAATLSWTAATDNQYASEPDASLRYRVYRKKTSNFANLLEPWSGGTMLAEQASLTFTDTNDFESGAIYYYAVCAVDASENVNCDGNFKSVTIPDLTLPEILTLATNKTAPAKTWNLTWTASDNITSNANLLFRVKYRYSADANAVLNDTDTTLFTQLGASGLTNLTGPLNTDTYIHYLLTVSDEAGNAVKKQITVYSQNKVEITSVKASEGSVMGGKLLYIVGKDFHSSSTVSIGGSACGSLQIISDKHMTCRSPAKTEGTYSLTVTNSDTSSGTLANAYAACTPNSTCQQICNNPSQWEADFAKSTGRGSAEATPILICAGAHLWNLTTRGMGLYYEIGDNIDLSSYTGNSWSGIYSSGQTDYFGGYINGGGYAVTNLTYNNTSAPNSRGLFRRFVGGTKIANLAVLNANVTGVNYVGILVGSSDSSASTIVQDVVVHGTVVGNDNVGGLGGEYRGALYRAYAYTNVTGNYGAGGVVGVKAQAMADVRWEGTFTTTATNANNVGGIVGAFEGNNGTATNIVGIGTVTNNATSEYHTGGAFGYIRNHTIKDSSFEGTVVGRNEVGGFTGWIANGGLDNVSFKGTVSGGYRVAGLSGWNRKSTIKNSVNKGTVNNTGGHTAGIMAYTEGNSTEVNLIENTKNEGKIAGGQDTGGLVGISQWVTIKTSSNSGTITGVGSTGGLLGWNGDTAPLVIETSFNTGSVTGTGDNIGGLFGGTDNGKAHMITNSFNTGKIQGPQVVGGIAGRFQGTMKNCYSSGEIISTNSHYSGGLIGNANQPSDGRVSLVESNYTTGKITGINPTSGTGMGGLIGNIEGRTTVRKNYTNATVSGFEWVGGLAGGVRRNAVLIEQNYTLGKVHVVGAWAGGFIGVGCIESSTVADCVIKNNYSRSNVEANNRAGGFIAWAAGTITNNFSTGRVDKIDAEAFFAPFFSQPQSLISPLNNFWDKTSSGRATGGTTGVTGKTTTEMKDPNTFSSFDNSVWLMSAGNYPRLMWEAP